MQREERESGNDMTTSRTPVLLLLDNLLSQDAEGIQSVLHTMRRELPAAVVNTYLSTQPSPDTVQQHLSVYLQTFPHQAAVASANDGSLPLHFAASLGDVTLSHIVWQAVRYKRREKKEPGATTTRGLSIFLCVGSDFVVPAFRCCCMYVCGSQPCFLVCCCLLLPSSCCVLLLLCIVVVV